MPRFRIQGLDRATLGHVYGKDKGAALQAAVDQKLVTGKKKIFAATPVAANDPYEQSHKDIWGEPKKPTVFRFPLKPEANAWPKQSLNTA